MTKLFKENELLGKLNNNAFYSPKVKVVNADAFSWVKQNQGLYDCIIADFPDPSNYSVGKLYTLTIYRELYRLLNEQGILVVQSTSPYVARRSYWCINHTMGAAGFHTIPYHTYVPSFGEWGYTMATKNYSWHNTGQLPKDLKYISPQTLKDIIYFPSDMSDLPTDTNKLNNQVLVHYFEEDWAPYVH